MPAVNVESMECPNCKNTIEIARVCNLCGFEDPYIVHFNNQLSTMNEEQKKEAAPGMLQAIIDQYL